jgi:hypothetical protein
MIVAWSQFLDSILKKTHHKNRAGEVAQSVGPKIQPQHWKKEKPKPLKKYLTTLYSGNMQLKYE